MVKTKTPAQPSRHGGVTRWRFAMVAALAATALATAALRAPAQQPPDPPKTGAESFGRDLARLGQSVGEYRDVQNERRSRIGRLDAELAACGTCAERERITRELAAARAAEATMARVEADTLQSLGLSQCASSFDGLLQALAQGLSARYDVGTEHTRRRIGDTISTHCAAEARTDVNAILQCVNRQNPQQQFVMFDAALRLCQVQMGDNYANLCRSGAGCDRFEQCMRANSGAVALCADNVSRRLQPAVSRCFASMLRPELFGGAMGADDRQSRQQQQREERAQREDAQRDKRCKAMAERLQRWRETAEKRPGGNTKLLERDQATYDRECGG